MVDDISLTEMPGHLIRRLNQQSSSVFQDRIKRAGFDLTSVQFAALSTLEKHPGLDQATLAKRIAYDRATIGGVVKRLNQKQLIHRLQDKEDRRAFKLWLSHHGKTLLAEITPIVVALQDDILPGLTPDEKATLIRMMKVTLQRKN